MKYVLLAGFGHEDTLRGFDELEGMTGLVELRLFHLDGEAWLGGLKSAPESLRDLKLYNCVVPPRSRFFMRFGGLEMLTLEHCVTPDRKPVTALDVPGVRVRID